MLIELRGATIVDPLHEQNGLSATLYVRDGRFVAPPPANQPSAPNSTQHIDLSGKLLMAGGIDIHTHIGGGKVNLARLLMSSENGASPLWPTRQTGQLYNQMGYTACFEPAMLLSGARHTHLELADTPLLDSGAYVVVGNEEWLLEALGRNIEAAELQGLVGWAVTASRALAVKVVNPGGISAFKYNQRMLAIDEPHVRWGVTPRDVIRRLTATVDHLGLAHPLHVHAGNLGVPGNVRTTLATLDAAEGRRIHLTHAQFNCYSTSGNYGMGSGAEELARYVNAHSNVSLDVGQIVFGQTVTISADVEAQYRNHQYAKPRRWVIGDVESQAGCGVVPMRYEDQQYVHALQWTIGLELMLLIEDPWRVFLTTDHPNGGPFTSYPHLMRLLMDRTYRLERLEAIHPLAGGNSLLRELTREYTLDEIAIVTRAAPAKILGLEDRGSVRDGCRADLAVYEVGTNWEATFSQATMVMKGGRVVRQLGEAVPELAGGRQAICAEVSYDHELVRKKFADAIEQRLRLPLASLEISRQEMDELF